MPAARAQVQVMQRRLRIAAVAVRLTVVAADTPAVVGAAESTSR